MEPRVAAAAGSFPRRRFLPTQRAAGSSQTGTAFRRSGDNVMCFIAARAASRRSSGLRLAEAGACRRMWLHAVFMALSDARPAIAKRRGIRKPYQDESDGFFTE